MKILTFIFMTSLFFSNAFAATHGETVSFIEQYVGKLVESQDNGWMSSYSITKMVYSIANESIEAQGVIEALDEENDVVVYQVVCSGWSLQSIECALQ